MTTLTSSLAKGPALPTGTLTTFAPLAGLAFVYLVVNLVLPSLVHGGWNLYLLQPLLWLGLAVWCLRNGRQTAQADRAVLFTAALFGFLQLAVFVAAGLLFGFGQSPYARSLLAISGNAAYLIASLAATELVRASLLQSPRRPGSVVAVVVLFAAFALPASQWQNLAGGETNPFLFSGERLAPALVESGVATLLSILGGPWAALTYRAVIEGGEWLSPVLPALTWSQTALASVLVAAAGVLVLRPGAEPTEATSVARRQLPGWAVAGAFVIAGVIWLNSGLLGVQPAIISGISMEPSLRQGDIVFTRSVSTGSLRPGDIIRFDEGGIPVLHRVKQVVRAETGIVFVTQGDNNAYADAPVPAHAVDGRVVLTIPKLGLIPITVRSWLGR